jgi:hypothetical protein
VDDDDFDSDARDTVNDSEVETTAPLREICNDRVTDALRLADVSVGEAIDKDRVAEGDALRLDSERPGDTDGVQLGGERVEVCDSVWESVEDLVILSVLERLHVNDGVTHSTSCFHPASGLHRPLWFAHQWQRCEYAQYRSGSPSHAAAHCEGFPASAASRQYPRASHAVHGATYGQYVALASWQLAKHGSWARPQYAMLPPGTAHHAQTFAVLHCSSVVALRHDARHPVELLVVQYPRR